MGESSTQSSQGQCNVVQCVIDNQDATTLTLRYHNQWFYVTATPSDFANDKIRKHYQELVKAARVRQEDIVRAQSGQARIKDQPERDGVIEDKKLSSEKDEEDESHARDSRDEEPRDSDSGYASKAPSFDDSEVDEQEDDEEKLHAWLQVPLEHIFTETRDKKQKGKSLTLSEWYETDLHFYRLKCDKAIDRVEAVARDDLDGPSYIQKTLTPRTKMPKYITELAGLKWFSPEELRVEAESHDIHLPIHPTLIRVEGEESTRNMECFLKLASLGDERAVKREIKFLHELSKRNLYQHGIIAPRLVGLVPPPSQPRSRSHILGFMISLIPQPTTPLTEMMTTKVSQSKRDKWAGEAEDMVAKLHKHDLTWGDAKADNFLVDKDEKLWIIDFGGSYTPGWIDEKLADSQEGDEMGVGKTSNGLRDPENGTYEDETEVDNKSAAPSHESGDEHVSKRKRKGDESEADSKRRKRDS